MDMKWAELNEYDFASEPPTGQFSDKLLAVFNETLSTEPSLGTDKPPLVFLLPTIKGMIYPTFVSPLMLDFLRLMTMVEFHRLKVVQDACDMLEWHEYQLDHEKPDIRFEEEDYDALVKFVQDSSEVRECFVQMLAQGCREDLQRIWLTGTNTQFWVRWNDYFSIFTRRDRDRASSPKTPLKTPLKPPLKVEPFHVKLAPFETAELRRASEEVTAFMEATTTYSIALKGRGHKATPEAIYRMAVKDAEARARREQNQNQNLNQNQNQGASEQKQGASEQKQGAVNANANGNEKENEAQDINIDSYVVLNQLEVIAEADIDNDTLAIVQYYLGYVEQTLPEVHKIMRRGDRRPSAQAAQD